MTPNYSTIPTRVEWLDHGVTVSSDPFPDEWIARDFVRQELPDGALDDGVCWLVPAWDVDDPWEDR